MASIFISYRRDDTQGEATHLSSNLREHFGKDQVFLDAEGIPAGADFLQVIENKVESCDVMLVMIGKRWLSLATPSGHRRLDDHDDFVRLEIAAALQRDIPTIPILVQDATLPSVNDLPEEVKPLIRRHRHNLTQDRWDHDVAKLVESLRATLKSSWLERFKTALSAGKIKTAKASFVTIILLLIAVAATPFLFPPLSPLSDEDAVKEVLESLYRDDAFAIDRYFTPDLAQLYLEDENKGNPSEGMKLDFDPFMSGQDTPDRPENADRWAIGNPIFHAGDAKVVVYIVANNAEHNEITYSLVRTKSGWRIDDIRYEEPGMTLRNILSGLAPGYED